MGRLRIAFDPWVLAARFKHHGTHVYAQNLLRHLASVVQKCGEVQLCVTAADSMALGKYDRLWRLGGASFAARKLGVDLLFSPSCNVMPIGEPPMVCTIHDVTPLAMPSHARHTVLAQRFFLRSAAKGSARIITVSEHSRNDIMEFYGVAEGRISVVYNGYDEQLYNTEAADVERQGALQERLGICRPYLFHHGVIQPRKNLERLIHAYRALLSRRRDLDLDLVLAGPLGWRYEPVLRAAAESEHLRGRVILTGPLDDGDLALLLKGAALVAIPSLYEGFCLPMIEAMACGIPTVASNNSCLPEISGGALLYFDPLAVEEMSSTIESALFSEELRRQLIGRGIKRVRQFSWEKCARETLEVLLKAADFTPQQLSKASA